MTPTKHGIPCSKCEKYVVGKCPATGKKLFQLAEPGDERNCGGCKYEPFKNFEWTPEAFEYFQLYDLCSSGMGGLSFLPKAGGWDDQDIDVQIAFEYIKGIICRPQD